MGGSGTKQNCPRQITGNVGSNPYRHLLTSIEQNFGNKFIGVGACLQNLFLELPLIWVSSVLK